MRKRNKIGALALAAVIAFSVLVLPKTHAAGPIEINKSDCKIAVNVANNVYPAGTATGFGELATLGVDVNLYRVATVDVSGDFTGIGKFSDVDLTGMSIDEDENEVAQYWENKAAEVKGIVDANTDIEAVSKTTSNGTVEFTGLQTGLYLVDAQTKESTTNVYSFKPYLIALPGNNYDPSASVSSDAWIYEITVGLKPEKANRYGDLVITKTLNAYNETIGGATFVFQVDAVKEDVDTNQVVYSYSDVHSLTFNDFGSNTITIKNIPAGADVTVTEVYTGASYELVTAASQATVIVADSEVGVAFENTYNEKVNGGSGKVNAFKATKNDDGWSWDYTMSDASSIVELEKE